MSDKTPENGQGREIPDRTIDLTEEKSITGSAQMIGIEPSEDFVAPTMALDSFEPESDS